MCATFLFVECKIFGGAEQIGTGVVDLFERFGREGAQERLLRQIVDILDRKSTRLNSSHEWISRMPSSA